MKRLTAQRPILYGGRMYQAGDTLPMTSAWCRRGFPLKAPK